MKVDSTPGTILAIEQLLRLFQLFVIVRGCAAVGATPILDDVPVCSFATVAGSDGTLVVTGGVKVTDNVATFFGKRSGQHTFIL
jgi:hypothetical protein